MARGKYLVSIRIFTPEAPRSQHFPSFHPSNEAITDYKRYSGLAISTTTHRTTMLPLVAVSLAQQ